MKKRRLNIHKVLDEVVLLLTKGHKGPTFVKEYDPSLPPVLGDEDKLTQVLLNLIKNAREAIGEKEGEVRVITRMVTDFHLVDEGSKEAKLAAVEIRDTGCGIPQENLEKVFTPFFTTKPGGSGLGMAISYRIIKEHGGFLTIDSKPGGGTRVDVYLPTAE
jgi:two-component system nitrogen regulation sensor histidine kinase GlnL